MLTYAHGAGFENNSTSLPGTCDESLPLLAYCLLLFSLRTHRLLRQGAGKLPSAHRTITNPHRWSCESCNLLLLQQQHTVVNAWFVTAVFQEYPIQLKQIVFIYLDPVYVTHAYGTLL